MGLVDFPMADGIDPDLGKLPGLLAEEIAIDQIVDRRGDEETVPSISPARAAGRPTRSGERVAIRRSASAGKDHGRQRQQPEAPSANIASGESKPASSPATARELSAR